MKKYYVLDTNILIHTNGDALTGFDDNYVVITDVVLEELDKLNHDKKIDPELIYSIGEVINKLDIICKDNYTTIDKTINKIKKKTEDDLECVFMKMPNKGTLIFLFSGKNLLLSSSGFSIHIVDNIIIAQAQLIKKKHPKTPVIIVTDDRLMRIKCIMVGVDVEEYRNSFAIKSIKNQYTGRIEINVSEDNIKEFYKNKFIDTAKIKLNDKIYENQYVKITATSSALCIYRDKILYNVGFNSKSTSNEYKWLNVTPKNTGQQFAIDALMRPATDVPLVILKGCAGSGKTFLAIAAALAGVESGLYKKIIISRSNTILKSEDLGFLPGTMEEKMSPLIDPFKDNLEALTGDIDELENKLDRGTIEIVPMAYIRGRTFNDSFVILDEAQNITPMQATTIVTRAGFNTKMVLLGDPTQRDTTKLSALSNGLIFTSERMKGSKLCAQVTFTDEESVRSDLAKEAIQRMSL